MKWYYWLVIVVITVLVIIILFKLYRKNRLLNKYNNEEVVGRILDSKIWQGMTKEQLLDSMGKPESMSEEVLKTKSKSVWKYGKIGHNRYSLRVNLENGEVIGWNKKA